jgi:hypothetical protein
MGHGPTVTALVRGMSGDNHGDHIRGTDLFNTPWQGKPNFEDFVHKKIRSFQEYRSPG